jgi:DUF4097 and DUF4098 domain-containing protein YvlB
MKLRIVACLTIALAGAAFAQTPELRCGDNNSNRDNRFRFCEMREQTIAYPGQLTIDGRQNGGISVRGSNRSDVLVRMKVESWARNEAEARSLAGQVRANLAAGKIAADGPDVSEGGWSVSYEVFVPRQANVEAQTHNGGIHVADVHGNVQFSAVNGGIHLAGVGGDIHGKTVNGGLHIQLSGNRWEGNGLDVTTTNGGVHLEVPANYSARLETSTVNGGMHADYPLTVSGKIGKQVSATLGSGGATLKLATTNGGVHINQI